MRVQYDLNNVQIYIYIKLPQGPWILAGYAYLKIFDAQPTLTTTYPQVFYTVKMDDIRSVQPKLRLPQVAQFSNVRTFSRSPAFKSTASR